MTLIRPVCLESCDVGRSCKTPDAGNAGWNICDNLIHSGEDDDRLRSVDQTGKTISVSVDIDQFSIDRNGIGTHKEDFDEE